MTKADLGTSTPAVAGKITKASGAGTARTARGAAAEQAQALTVLLPEGQTTIRCRPCPLSASCADARQVVPVVDCPHLPARQPWPPHSQSPARGLEASATPAAPAARPAAQDGGACPLAALGRKAAALAEVAHGAEEARVTAAGPAARQLQREQEAAEDRLTALEDYASHVGARSIEGAMFALMLANHDLGLLDVGLEPHDADACRRRVSRHLYSALRALEALSGTPAAALGAARYMDAALDPAALVRSAAA